MTTGLDYSKERYRIYRVAELKGFENWKDKDWVMWLTHVGYPCKPGTWTRVMGPNGRLSKCFVRAVARTLECDVADLVQAHRYERMRECGNGRHWHHPDTGELLSSTPL